MPRRKVRKILKGDRNALKQGASRMHVRGAEGSLIACVGWKLYGARVTANIFDPDCSQNQSAWTRDRSIWLQCI